MLIYSHINVKPFFDHNRRYDSCIWTLRGHYTKFTANCTNVSI